MSGLCQKSLYHTLRLKCSLDKSGNYRASSLRTKGVPQRILTLPTLCENPAMHFMKI